MATVDINKLEKLKEKSTNKFKYIPLNLSFNIEKIEKGKICIINPGFCNINNDNLFLIREVVIVYISDIYIENQTTFNEEVIHINRKGNIIKRL